MTLQPRHSNVQSSPSVGNQQQCAFKNLTFQCYYMDVIKLPTYYMGKEFVLDWDYFFQVLLSFR